jgi:hypothetical protein
VYFTRTVRPVLAPAETVATCGICALMLAPELAF